MERCSSSKLVKKLFAKTTTKIYKLNALKKNWYIFLCPDILLATYICAQHARSLWRYTCTITHKWTSETACGTQFSDFLLPLHVFWESNSDHQAWGKCFSSLSHLASPTQQLLNKRLIKFKTQWVVLINKGKYSFLKFLSPFIIYIHYYTKY